MNRTRVAAVAVTSTAALGLSATPASAYSFERDWVTSDKWMNGKAYCAWKSYPTPGVGCWERKGDYIQVGDTMSDSARVGVHWRTGYGRRGICVSARGHDTAIPGNFIPGHYSCNKNMKEGRKIQMRVGRCNASKVNCGRLSNWTTGRPGAGG